MSGPSGSDNSGVVQNSALTFLATAQAVQRSSDSDLTNQEKMVPAGFKTLCDAFSQLYPDQPNPLQVTTRLKYWLGGQDPLDYISMYWNPGKPEDHIPAHWHYVSFGLSDLHGDGRVHPPPSEALSTNTPSGYGFELTFRLAHTGAPGAPPLWPAALLQALARYVFTTGNKLCAGDHITWHSPLAGREASPSSRVKHLLVARDPQLDRPVSTPHGSVNVLQIVGCTPRELRAAQRGSGFEVLKRMAEDTNCGGSWLVTRAHRRFSARGVRTAPSSEPAELAGVSANLRWMPYTIISCSEEPSPCHLTPRAEEEIKQTLERGLTTMSMERQGPEGHNMSTDSFEMSSMERALPQIPELMQGSWRSDDIEYLDGVHLIMNAEGASLLPLAINGRVAHGRHFTWRSGTRAVTVLSSRVSGASVDERRPYARQGDWLQILIPQDIIKDMSTRFESLTTLSHSDSESDSDSETDGQTKPNLPIAYTWSNRRLAITVVQDVL